MLALSAALACGKLGTDLDQVVAVDVAAPDSLEEADTLRPRARALDGRGDSVAVPIAWATLDTALLTVIDSTSGKTVAKKPGPVPGRLQAHVGNLRSSTLSIRLLAAADTLSAAGPLRDTVVVSTPDSLSDSLAVALQDTITTPPSAAPLAGRPVVFAITYPAGSTAVTLVTSDTARGLVTADTAFTKGSGIAAVKVRLVSGLRPDSVVVTAQARRAVGTSIPGSPVTFIVEFRP